MSFYQPHQMRKKFAAGPRHTALAGTGRITPITNRLRLEELANELPAEVVTHQHEGVRQRVSVGKATQPTPE
ncbi:MAG: hypothetical protein HKN93_12415 [Acidimicrobiia bacterium]|nr:hypothetical protein [Acidimicrobiia bacterium]